MVERMNILIFLFPFFAAWCLFAVVGTLNALRKGNHHIVGGLIAITVTGLVAITLITAVLYAAALQIH